MDVIFQAYSKASSINSGLDGKQGSGQKKAVIVGFIIIQICADSVAVVSDIVSGAVH